jgi:hypothetical protein
MPYLLLIESLTRRFVDLGIHSSDLDVVDVVHALTVASIDATASPTGQCRVMRLAACLEGEVRAA